MKEQSLRARSPLAVEEHEDADSNFFSVFFHRTDVPQLAKALAKAGQPVNGYSVEAVMIVLSELKDPAWAKDLHFDSENDLFSVDCSRRAPLTFLVRRLRKRLINPAALRRLIKGTSFYI